MRDWYSFICREKLILKFRFSQIFPKMSNHSKTVYKILIGSFYSGLPVSSKANQAHLILTYETS